MAARVHRSHDTHDTFFPPSTRWRSPRCRGRERGLKCRNKNAHPFSRSVGINMNQRFFFLGGGAAFNIHPWIHISILIYLICLLFRFLFSSPWRVLVALEISACVEGHGYMESDIKILRILDWHRLVLLRSDICWTNTASVLSLSLVCQKSQNDSATGHKNQRHTGQLRGSNVQFSWGSLIVHCLVYGTTPP